MSQKIIPPHALPSAAFRLRQGNSRSLCGKLAGALLLSLLTATTAVAQTPLTLRQCIDRALSRNVQVKVQENTVRSQELALNSERNARLPEVAANGSQSFDFGRGLTSDNTYSNRNTQSTGLNVSASMPLFTGFRIPQRKAQARLNLAAATADLEKLRNDLGIQVAQAYLEALCQQDFHTQALIQLDLSRKQLERIEGLRRAGKASEAEVSEIRSSVAQDELSAVEADNSRRLALLALSQLIEMPTPDSLALCDNQETPAEGMEGSPQGIYDEAVMGRPEVQAATLRVESAERAIRIARSGYWPSLSLSAGLGSSFYHTSGFANNSFGRQMRDNFSKAIGISLSIPIFDRFSARNAIRQARIDHDTYLWQTEEVKKTLYKEIQQAWYNAVAARQKYTASLAAEQAAADALQLMTRKYETGKANATEYEEARTKSLNAACQRIAARYECIFRAKILDFYRGRELQ